MRFLIYLFVLSLGYSDVYSQGFNAAVTSTKVDLDKALKELAVLEKKIADEKIPLARELNQLESNVIIKRREYSNAIQSNDRKAIDLDRLKAEEKAFKDQNDYLRKTLLEEYMRRFEARIHASEKDQYADIVKEARQSNENPTVNAEQVFINQLVVVNTALERLENLLGGHVFEGSAIVDGVPERGKLVMLGPVVMFFGNSGISGMAEQLRGTTKATLIDLEDEDFSLGIKNTIDLGAGDLLID